MINQPVTAETQAGRIDFSLGVSFIICFLCSFSAGLMSTLMSVYLPDVVKDLAGQNSLENLARISAYIQSLYIGGWAIGGFFWGMFSDRIGRVKALSISVIMFGLSTTLISFGNSWEWVVAFRLMSGLAVGGILVITPTLLLEIWPLKTRAIMVGIDSIGVPVGIFSSGLITVIADNWREAFMIGLLPLALGIISWFFLMESRQWKSTDIQHSSKATQEDRINLLKGSVIFGTMLIGLWGMFSWIPTWVQSLLPDSVGQSERGISMMLLGGGGLLGGFVSGWVCNLLGPHRSMILCFCGCIFFSVLLFGFNHSFSPIIYPELGLLSFCFGISQGLLSIYIPMLFPAPIRGTFTGICFNSGRVITALAIFFVGVLVTVFGGYGNTLLAFAGIFILGLITIFITRNDNKK